MPHSHTITLLYSFECTMDQMCAFQYFVIVYRYLLPLSFTSLNWNGQFFARICTEQFQLVRKQNQIYSNSTNHHSKKAHYERTFKKSAFVFVFRLNSSPKYLFFPSSVFCQFSDSIIHFHDMYKNHITYKLQFVRGFGGTFGECRNCQKWLDLNKDAWRWLRHAWYVRYLE